MNPIALQKKEKSLRGLIKKMGRVLLAYSGGVDSSLLLKIAADELGAKNVFAVTAKSVTYPHREYKSARRLARMYGVEFATIKTDEMKDKRFIKNPVNRCYYCKKELFKKLTKLAVKKGIGYVIDGLNYEDRHDFRFGATAAKELGIRSPLSESRLTKNDIRRISKRLGIPTWNKPAFACLASRLPYNSRISTEKINMIDKAEKIFYDNGFKQVRVRLHDDLARIELLPGDIRRFVKDKEMYKKILKKLNKIGFLYISVDLEGYKSGNMNKNIIRRETC